MLLFLFFLFLPRQFGQPFLNLPYTLFAKRPPPPMLSTLPPFPIAESFLSNQTLPLLKTKPILEAKIHPSSRQPSPPQFEAILKGSEGTHAAANLDPFWSSRAHSRRSYAWGNGLLAA